MNILLFCLTLAANAGWENRVKHLSDAEFDHYYALKVYMEDDKRKAFLKLKTEDERNEFLKNNGLWDKFYQYDEHIRQTIVDGDVQTGWTKDMVLMSWGKPFKRRRLTGRPAERSVMFIYRFEKHADGSVLVWEDRSKTEYKAVMKFSRELYMDDDVVSKIETKKDGW